MLRVAVVGAGAVGLALGTRLAASGSEVLFVVRRPEVARCIERDGTRVENVETGAVLEARPAVVLTSELEAGELEGDELRERLLLFATRAPDLPEAAAMLAAVAPAATAVAAQNDVDNEELLARHFPRVLGMVVRNTFTRSTDNAVRTSGAGRLIVGAHPSGGGPDVEDLAAALSAAGIDVGLSSCIGDDKWLKLAVNLMTVPNALIDPAEHATRDFSLLKARLLEEARDVFRAAGIAARACDGCDRSLDEEIAQQLAAHGQPRSARGGGLYNGVWASLRHGAPLEADRYHRRILALAAQHALPAPLNARALELVERARAEGRGPESFSCRDFLG